MESCKMSLAVPVTPMVLHKPKLHGACFTVWACLFEKDIAFDFVPVNTKLGEQSSPSHLAINPFGKIPGFEDGHLKLFESRAINRYLCKKYKAGTDLLRDHDLYEASMVEVWMEVEAQQNFPPQHEIILEFSKTYSGLTPDMEIVEAQALKLGKVLDIYEARLSKFKYLAGDYFSLADLNHLSFTWQLMNTEKADLINSRPHVKAWWEDISSRPCWTKSLDYAKKVGLM